MLVEIILLAPLGAALILALGQLSGRIAGEHSERFTSRVALAASVLSLSGLLVAAGLRYQGQLPALLELGTWLRSGDYRIGLNFSFDRLSLSFALLSSLFSLLVLRFSIHYLHREPGFHRFFMILSLFGGAMLLLALAGNAALAFAGWELAGVCSYLLIAYAYDRPTAAANATRAFVTNRIGDAGFVAGIFLAFAWTGSLDWNVFTSPDRHLAPWQAGVTAACFLLAGTAKSAQVPLAPWISRAMEGPTPSSAIFYGAVMVHAGVFLMLRLQPLLEHSPLVMGLMAGIGLLSAAYGFFCGLSQTDVKSALIFSATGQVGLMFLEAGLGFWELALWHLLAHAVLRGYQFLSAPSLMHQVAGHPTRPVPRILAVRPRLYLASLQRLWLEPLGDWLAVRPMQRLARDLYQFDSRYVERFWGIAIPAARRGAAVSIAAGPNPEVIRVSGVAGCLTASAARLLYWFEDRLVLRGVGQSLMQAGRRLGAQLNRLENLLNEPRYLVLFIAATLIALL